jgi:hypothetical protein
LVSLGAALPRAPVIGLTQTIGEPARLIPPGPTEAS